VRRVDISGRDISGRPRSSLTPITLDFTS